MHTLRRTVRVCIDLSDHQGVSEPRNNTYAGWPSMPSLGAFYEFVVTCKGDPDSATGYVIDISRIDEAVRNTVVEPLQHLLRSRPRDTPDPVVQLRRFTSEIRRVLGDIVAEVEWRLTPYYAIAMSRTRPERVLLRQHFDFAASHRLAIATYSDEQNLATFGKCSNPTGHGHNYRLEAAVQVSCSGGSDNDRFSLAALERIVRAHVLDRFDHRNLNEDVEEFASVLPTVENIARVCFDRLEPPIAEEGGRLESVTVWETERTCSTYSRSDPGSGP